MTRPVNSGRQEQMTKKTWMSWSTGKDSACSLWKLQQSDAFDVVGLLTTVNADHERVAMHSTRQELLGRQAAAVGLPVEIIDLPQNCTNEFYEERMTRAMSRADQAEVEAIAFGDLFLEDIRQYREKMMADQRIKPIFPLWQEPTGTLARHIVDSGFEAYLTCIDPKQLSADFAGRKYDNSLLQDLPESVDPCGENGEFHTFVFNGPNFSNPISCVVGETVERDGFVFADIVPS